MFDDKQQIMERVKSLPKGARSASGRYWCVTCKMLFSLDEPVCPYVPKMCINTPIPVELLPVESAITLEKFGLFYPKVPQKLMAHLADTDDANRRSRAGRRLSLVPRRLGHPPRPRSRFRRSRASSSC